MDIILNDYERIDDLQINGLRIIQDKRGFCFGIDAVLLSHFSEVKMNEKVIDLGTGTGVIPLLLSAKTMALSIDGLEIQSVAVDMAKRSVRMNGLENRINILEGDIRQLPRQLKNSFYDVVTSNPPYMKRGDGLLNNDDSKAVSRHEIKCSFNDVMRAANYLLKDSGRIYLIHRPGRLVDILSIMREEGIEPKLMRLVYAGQGKAPELVLIKGLKGGGKELKIVEPLYIYNNNGGYTSEIMDIYSSTNNFNKGNNNL